jgi:hypothetical protein
MPVGWMPEKITFLDFKGGFTDNEGADGEAGAEVEAELEDESSLVECTSLTPWRTRRTDDELSMTVDARARKLFSMF